MVLPPRVPALPPLPPVLACALLGCSLNVTEVQDIVIDHYTENERNVELVEELLYYDSSYLAAKIPSFDEQTSKGIRLGYFIRSSDGVPSYRVTYDLKNPDVAAAIDVLKEQFEAFIPELAAHHASKEAVFSELEPVGRQWAQSIFTEPASRLFDETSSVLKSVMTRDEFAERSGQLRDYGKPGEVRFLRAQYYEAFDEIPESVSLFYEAEFTRRKPMIIRISLQEAEEWRVMGFLWTQTSGR